MKFFIYILLLFILYGSSIYAQPLVVNWQKCMGGSDIDGGNKIRKTHNGFILFCTSSSSDGQVIGNHGLADYWVIRTDTTGNILWSKTYGGTDYDVLKQMRPTSDGGFIIIGQTFSNDGDVQGNHGGSDYWVIKIDSLGNLQWQKCLGGSSLDFGEDVDVTFDSGFICTGWSASNDGNVTGNHGSYDYWIVKLDKNGNIKWEHSFGSSYPDFGFGITSTNDGGAILAGGAGIGDGDVQCNYHGGDADAWIVKLDSTGTIEWQQCYGGSMHDMINIILPLTDGSYLCAGITASNDGQVTGNHGSMDFWVFKIDHLGYLLSQKSFGGSDMDSPNFMKASSDGNYFIGGSTFSNDGDVSGNHSVSGSSDIWLIKISPNLQLLWQQCLGGDGDEDSYDLLETDPGKYILLGYTNTINNSGNVNCHEWGSKDIWMVSLTDTTYTGIVDKNNFENPLRVYPNPANREVVFKYQFPQNNPGTTLRIYNVFGQIIKEFSLEDMQGKIIWNAERALSGLYIYQLVNYVNTSNGKFCIIH